MIFFKGIWVVCCMIVLGQTQEDEHPNNDFNFFFGHQDPQNPPPSLEVTSIQANTTYVRWGRSVCNDDKSDTVYSGFVGGGHYSHTGAGTNALCLPDSPEYDDSLVVSGGSRSNVYGAEYETSSYSPLNGANNRDAVCAVCLTRGRSTTLMIPGKRMCPEGWTKEYGGLLMGGSHGHAGNHEYLCMDRNPQGRTDASTNQDGFLFYPAAGICGSLSCPPYVNNNVLSCVVCSR